MKSGGAKDRDAFFTKSEIAKHFVDKINEITPFDKFDKVIEPSAGSGRILDHLPLIKSIGYDIHPMRDDVIEADFMNIDLSSNKKTIVVMNPPFKRQGKGCIEFFNHSASFDNVVAIAWIVPRSFMKYRSQNRLDKDWGLWWTAILPDDSFTLDEKDYAVRCCCQLWVRKGYEHLITPMTEEEQWETWNEKVSAEMLWDIHQYQLKHQCYEDNSLSN